MMESKNETDSLLAINSSSSNIEAASNSYSAVESPRVAYFQSLLKNEVSVGEANNPAAARPEEFLPIYEEALLVKPNKVITCRVCQSSIDLTGKESNYVVKCTHCGEATPLESAPKGKKYVRCPCNCLLVCKVTSQRIACPRPKCKRVINLMSNSNSPSTPTLPGKHRVVCFNCQRIFLFDIMKNVLAKCPHCYAVSSVGRQFARARASLFFIIGLILLAVASVIFFLGSSSSNLIFAVLIILLLMDVYVVFRGIYYYRMRVSEIDEPQ